MPKEKKQKMKKKSHKIIKIILITFALVIALVAIIGFIFFRRMNAPLRANLNASEDAVATTTAGLVKGAIDDGIYVYLGMPYAEAKERFVRAEALEPWDGVREYTEYGAISLQSSFMGMGGTDNQDNNCQNLNLWTPELNDGGKRPVMVWLHGGGFSSGSANEASTNGKNLAKEEDVVVVTVNHRLGAAGYLNLSAFDEKYKDSANVGMWDVIDALTWIQDNIEYFGGDPDNVTIFGQSGGGAKVLTLMSTPYAKGLFHKGINQSGATETVGPKLTPEEVSLRITELTLEKLGITAENIEDIQSISFEELNNAGTEAIAQVAEEFQYESPFGGSYSYEWEPVVEGDFLPTDPVLDEGFAETGYDIPLLIGSNLNEWNFMGRSSDVSEEVVTAFKEAYPNIDEENAGSVDSMLRVPLLRTTAHKADQGGAPVYSYIFTYGAPRCTHGAEIPYIFGNVDSTPADEAMEKTMRGIWAAFARTGIPQVDGIPTWEAYTRDGGATMIIGENSELAYNHDLKLLELLEPGFDY